MFFIDFFQDLATLLKSLYDAVGSSIKLPEAGAKTLKLRLSVSPDSAKLQADTNKTDYKDNRHRDSNNLKHMKNNDNSKLTTKETIKQNNLNAAMEKLNVQVQTTSKDGGILGWKEFSSRNGIVDPPPPPQVILTHAWENLLWRG